MMSNNSGSLSPNSRSPVTLGDFIKTRKSKNNKNSSPEVGSVQILRRSIPGHFRSSGGNPRNLFSRENQIDFSVNDIVFEKVENPLEEEMKWSENDVDFTAEQKPCSYRHCLQNDSGFQAFNNFRLNSYSSEESDVNFNNEHFYLPDPQQYTDYDSTYFPFERVEEDAYYGAADEGYYGTTYYQGDDVYYYNADTEALEDQQVVPNQNVSGIENIAETLLCLDISAGDFSPAPKGDRLNEKDKIEEGEEPNHKVPFEKDEELNNLVLSIIDDE
eukprot:GFUD01025642.1.p1 GENE.GFUD01025642.1~~GFUD01025642.1.p1  ORF type:complete len:299 (+),score=62.04 GFUD01025642.1:79-897(+)